MSHRDHFSTFAHAVAERLEQGASVYGNASFHRDPAELTGEIEQELLDVCAWSFIPLVPGADAAPTDHGAHVMTRRSVVPQIPWEMGTTAKRWFELECRHCGGRFLEMADLLFHRCPDGRTESPQEQRKGADEAEDSRQDSGTLPGR
jgi:hypothetical protein